MPRDRVPFARRRQTSIVADERQMDSYLFVLLWQSHGKVKKFLRGLNMLYALREFLILVLGGIRARSELSMAWLMLGQGESAENLMLLF